MWTLTSIKKLLESTESQQAIRKKKLSSVHSKHKSGEALIYSYESAHQLLDLLAQSEHDLVLLTQEIRRKVLGEK